MVCAVLAVVSTASVTEATGVVALVPDQAETVRLVFTVPPRVTETAPAASVAVATLDQTMVWMPVVDDRSIRVQPAGSLTVTVSALTVAVSTSASPACTAAGTVTVDVLPLALELAAPRNAIAVVGTETVTDRVVVAVPPRLSVTVSVIVYVPAAA